MLKYIERVYKTLYFYNQITEISSCCALWLRFCRMLVRLLTNTATTEAFASLNKT